MEKYAELRLKAMQESVKSDQALDPYKCDKSDLIYSWKALFEDRRWLMDALAAQAQEFNERVEALAREWESGELVPSDAIVDEKTRYLAGVREGIRRERKRCAAEIRKLKVPK